MRSSLLILCILCALCALAGTAAAADLSVGPGEAYTDIQTALDAAAPSDIITVRDGTYVENIDIVTEGITLRSEGGSAVCTIEAASSYDHAIFVRAPNVSIIGFTIINANDTSGSAGIAFVENSSAGTVTDCILSNNDYGIMVYGADAITITDNVVRDNRYDGIYILHQSAALRIAGNVLQDNLDSNVRVSESSAVLIENNTLTGSEKGIDVYLADGVDIFNNTITDNGHGVYLFISSQCVVYNNFLDNGENAFDDGVNIWSRPPVNGTNIVGEALLGGNYWSDYEGADADGDFIGDTAYAIAPGLSSDAAPLIKRPDPAPDAPFLSPETVIFIAVLLGIVLIVALYIRRQR